MNATTYIEYMPTHAEGFLTTIGESCYDLRARGLITHIYFLSVVTNF